MRVKENSNSLRTMFIGSQFTLVMFSLLWWFVWMRFAGATIINWDSPDTILWQDVPRDGKYQIWLVILFWWKSPTCTLSLLETKAVENWNHEICLVMTVVLEALYKNEHSATAANYSHSCDFCMTWTCYMERNIGQLEAPRAYLNGNWIYRQPQKGIMHS